MDTYFFDSPIKALIKWFFLLVTYMSSILLKQFSLATILPTVFIYLLSNLVDYVEISFMKESKSRVIKTLSFFFALLLAASAVFAFSVYSNSNAAVESFLSNNYYLIYIFCALIWLIPLIDGVRGFLDDNRKNSENVSQGLQSSTAYDVMTQSILNKPNK